MIINPSGTYAVKLDKKSTMLASEFSPFVSYGIQRNLEILYAFNNKSSLRKTIKKLTDDELNESPANSDWVSVKPFILLSFSKEVPPNWVGSIVKDCFDALALGSDFSYHFSQTRTNNNLYSFKIKCSSEILDRFMHCIQDSLKGKCSNDITVRTSKV